MWIRSCSGSLAACTAWAPGERLSEVEDTSVTEQYLDYQVQRLDLRLDDHHDQLQELATKTHNMKNIVTGITAGTRLGQVQPTNAIATAAIQSLTQMAEQMNKQAVVMNNLQARVDVVEFRQRQGTIFDSDNNNNSGNNNITIRSSWRHAALREDPQWQDHHTGRRGLGHHRPPEDQGHHRTPSTT